MVNSGRTRGDIHMCKPIGQLIDDAPDTAFVEPSRRGNFVQPRHLRPIHGDVWWSYDGPLAVVFTGVALHALRQGSLQIGWQ